eukprot:11606172-Prorocentrum_lima.AAC.1
MHPTSSCKCPHAATKPTLQLKHRCETAKQVVPQTLEPGAQWAGGRMAPLCQGTYLAWPVSFA